MLCVLSVSVVKKGNSYTLKIPNPGDLMITNFAIKTEGFSYFESHGERFCRILGREDLIDDPRSSTIRARGQNRQFLCERPF